MPKDEFVSVALIREDLRLLLVVADTHQLDLELAGKPRNQRLQLAIDRIASTASSTEWQPKRDGPPTS